MKNSCLRLKTLIPSYTYGILLLFILLLINTRALKAQYSNWTLTSSFTPSVCGGTATAPTAGSGVSNISATPNATSGYSGTGFTTSATAPSTSSTAYFQFTFTNTSANTITFSNESLTGYNGGSSAPNARMQWYYSTDGFTTSTLLASGISISPNSTATSSPGTNILVSAGQTLTIRVYFYRANSTSTTFGVTNIQLQASAPSVPSAFSASSGNTQNVLSSTADAASDNVILAYNTTNTFGTPVAGTVYNAGNSIPGGGTVLYAGAAGSNFYTHTGLTNGSTYYYSLWSVSSGSCGYSSALSANATPVGPCSTPSVATSLVLTPTTGSVSATFTAPASVPTGYIVIRTTSSTAPSVPVNGTAYSAGASALGGYVVSVNTGTGFTDNGLTPSTQYWYWIYSYNSSLCSGGPVYSATSLNGNTTTSGCSSNTLYWAGQGSNLAGTTGTDFSSTAANWSTNSSSYVASSTIPNACSNLVMNLTGTSNYTVSVSSNITVNSITINYTAAPTNSRTFTLNIGTYNFATVSNFTVNSGGSSKALTMNISISNGGNLTIGGNLSCAIPSSSQADVLEFSNSGTMTVNGTTLATDLSSSSSAGVEFLIGNSPAITTFNGSVTFDDGSNGSSSTSGAGIGVTTAGATGEFIFNGNLILGPAAFTIGVTNATVLFSGSSAQTITSNMNSYAFAPGIVQIGTGSGASAVTLSHGTSTNPLFEPSSQLVINNNATLTLGSGETMNSFNNGSGTISVLDSGTLIINGIHVTNSQTGSNFPGRYGSYTLGNNSTVTYNSTSSQTVYNGVTYGNLSIANSSSAVATAGGALTIAGNLTINNSAIFAASSYSHSIAGNFSNNGTFTAGTSTVNFNGSSAQIIGGSSATSFNNLTINNNSGGVSLIDGTNNQTKTVTGTLTLTSGLITTSTSNLLALSNTASTSLGNSSYTNTSYIIGPIQRTGSTAFVFPIGGANGYEPIGISATSNGSSQIFRAQYSRSSGSALGAISTGSTLKRVSSCDYWNLNLYNGSGTQLSTLSGATIGITLYWNQNNPCTGGYVNDLATLAIGHFNGTNWDEIGASGYSTSGGTTNGSITYAATSSFSPFALASTSGAYNPLPITLYYFNATKETGYNKLTWKAECTSSSSIFEAQRSTDGINYSIIDSVNVASACSSPFVYNDYNTSGEQIYYRLKMIDIDGTITYSNVVLISNNSYNTFGMTVQPNPVINDANLLVSLTSAQNLQLIVMNVNGAQVFSKSQQLHTGINNLTLPTSNLIKGMYIVKGVFANGQTKTLSFIKR
ncbi:MAG TPA: T9SS type A sorting domain-containing protein [Puia sp.]|nr:T9SS type A sorting domain-containing protein [Puia sp.]